MNKKWFGIAAVLGAAFGLVWENTGLAAEFRSFEENTVAQKQIADLSMYRVALSTNLPQYGNRQTGQPGWYDYSSPGTFASGYSSALFYLQMTRNDGTTEWVLVDAPNYSGTDFSKLGFSRYGVAGDVVNMVVTGSKVYASTTGANMPLFAGITADADGVKSITNAPMILEFWPYNYVPAAQSSKLDQNGNAYTLTTDGSKTTGYDWNDTPLTDGDHGSYQIHLYDPATQTGQTLIGVSRCYRTNEAMDVGIGNSGVASALDWTMAGGNPYKWEGRNLTVLAIPAYADTDRILDVAGSGAWGGASTWLDKNGNTITAPTATTNAFINGGTASITGAAQVQYLALGEGAALNVAAGGSLTSTAAAANGAQYLEGNFTSAGTLNFASDVLVNNSGTPTNFNLTGGFLTATNLYVANAATSRVNSVISNATVNGGTNFYIGNAGNADMTIDNSTATATQYINIANETGSVSSMTVRGAATNISTKYFNVGYRGTGVLNIYDGKIYASEYFCIGNNTSTAQGTVNQYGGTVESIWLPLGHNGKGFYNLYDGTVRVGTTGLAVGDRPGSNTEFYQAGGSVLGAKYIIVGNEGTGKYTLDGGLVRTGSTFFIGKNGGSKGTFVQNGGDINPIRDGYTAYRDVYIAETANSAGSYTMNGGTLTGNCMAVGNYGSGQFTLNDGTVYMNDWFLVGFRAGSTFTNKNLAKQYGGTLDAGWFTLGWEYDVSDGTYDMYGGTLNSRTRNPIIIAKKGTGTFHLYDGTVTAAGKDGLALQLGSEAEGRGVLDVYSGNFTANGNAAVSAKSSINFKSSVLGMGHLQVDGAFTQADGGKVTVKLADGISFFDNYDAAKGVDVLTITKDASTLKVTNESEGLLDVTTTATATGGNVNVKLKQDLNKGTVDAKNGGTSFVEAAAGWIGLEGFDGEDTFVLSMLIDTGDMEMNDFLAKLNSDLKVGDEQYVTAVYNEETERVQIALTADMLEAEAFTWNFANPEVYDNQVTMSAFQSNQVPEPAAWALFLLGLAGIAALRRR